MIRSKLNILLAERGMKQADLAREAGLPIATISRMVRGSTVSVNLNYLSRICEVLECSMSDIYEYVPEPSGKEPLHGISDQNFINALGIVFGRLSKSIGIDG